MFSEKWGVEDAIITQERCALGDTISLKPSSQICDCLRIKGEDEQTRVSELTAILFHYRLSCGVMFQYVIAECLEDSGLWKRITLFQDVVELSAVVPSYAA